MTKKTVGEHVLDRWNPADKHEVGETMDEIWRKEVAPRLEKIFHEHSWYKEPYYIQIIFKGIAGLPGAQQLNIFTRKTKPKANWGETVYRVDNSKEQYHVLWSLPKRAVAIQLFLQEHEDVDPQLLKWIRMKMDDKLE